MNEPKNEDVMRALECCCVHCNCNGCPYYHGEPEEDCHYKMMKAALALLREKDEALEDAYDYIRRLEAGKKSRNEEIAEYQKKIEQLQIATTKKDAEIEKFEYLMLAIKQQMIGDLEAIWCEGHGFIEYDDLKRWKEQYLKYGQM